MNRVARDNKVKAMCLGGAGIMRGVGICIILIIEEKLKLP
jgi:hypothetical protein